MIKITFLFILMIKITFLFILIIKINSCDITNKEIKKDKREDLFAATSPLEAKKMPFSLFASMPGMSLNFGDVVRAYFHARARRSVRKFAEGGLRGG